MPYSNFTTRDLKREFGVEEIYRAGIFTKVLPREVSEWLNTSLAYGVELALAQGTEKARSELIIAPVFVELRNQADRKISIFSGVEFNIDFEKGLIGRCDFLVSRSAYQSDLESPVVVAVEAKREDIDGGITQCVAEMIAARIFNEREGNNIREIYGCVTTGDVWRFLALRGGQAIIETVSFDVREDLQRIMGVLWAMTFDEIENETFSD